MIKVAKYLLLVLIFSSCSQETPVKSEKIKNFSDQSYTAAPSIPYFDEVKQLPYKITMGDYNDYNSIIHLTESSNVVPIDDENLQYYLTKEELASALDTHLNPSYTKPITRNSQYYPYERLVRNNYVLLVINKRINISKGRDYQFYLRTYTFDGQLISNFLFAKWDEVNKMYISGRILPEMKIKQVINQDTTKYFEIMENGEIVEIEGNTNLF